MLNVMLVPNSEWHDIHISKCSISWQEGQNSIDIQLHLFLDDLSLALDNQQHGELVVLDVNQPGIDQALLEYVTTKFTLKINNETMPLAWLSKSLSDDGQALWINLSIAGFTQISELRIGFDALMEVYDDQQNIVHLKGPGGKQGYFLFSKPGKEEVIIF